MIVTKYSVLPFIFHFIPTAVSGFDDNFSFFHWSSFISKNRVHEIYMDLFFLNFTLKNGCS
jgi:hypothetical protein